MNDLEKMKAARRAMAAEAAGVADNASAIELSGIRVALVKQVRERIIYLQRPNDINYVVPDAKRTPRRALDLATASDFDIGIALQYAVSDLHNAIADTMEKDDLQSLTIPLTETNIAAYVETGTAKFIAKMFDGLAFRYTNSSVAAEGNLDGDMFGALADAL